MTSCRTSRGRRPRPFTRTETGPLDGQFVPNEDLSVLSLPTSNLSTTIKLTSGRLPTGLHDAIVGFSMQQQFGLRIGSIVTVPFYSAAQRQQEFATNGFLPPHGPRESFRVVGFEVSESDFPSTSPSYSLYTSPAFDREVGRDTVFAGYLQRRLRHGVNDMPKLQTSVNHHQPKSGFTYMQNEDSTAAAIAQSIQPQATGWWFFALFATLAGLALVGQALSRQSLVERESYPALTAIGLRPQQLFGLGMVRAGAIGIAGALGAVVLELAVSPLTPVGEARAADPVPGFVFDPALLGLGVLIIVVVVSALAVAPSWRAAHGGVGRIARDQPVRHSNATVALVARTGAPPSLLVGVRNALDRGRGRSSVPVATALVGATVAVMALVATTVFGASLTHLVKTPPLYGQNWQLDMGSLTTKQVHTAIAEFDHDPTVTRVTYGFTGKYVRIGSVVVQGIFVDVAKGPLAFSLVNGHAAVGTHQMLLGSTTMSQAHLHVGSHVVVTLINKSGRVLARKLEVVGTVGAAADLEQRRPRGGGPCSALPAALNRLPGNRQPSDVQGQAGGLDQRRVGDVGGHGARAGRASLARALSAPVLREHQRARCADQPVQLRSGRGLPSPARRDPGALRGGHAGPPSLRERGATTTTGGAARSPRLRAPTGPGVHVLAGSDRRRHRPSNRGPLGNRNRRVRVAHLRFPFGRGPGGRRARKRRGARVRGHRRGRRRAGAGSGASGGPRPARRGSAGGLVLPARASHCSIGASTSTPRCATAFRPGARCPRPTWPSWGTRKTPSSVRNVTYVSPIPATVASNVPMAPERKRMRSPTTKGRAKRRTSDAKTLPKPPPGCDAQDDSRDARANEEVLERDARHAEEREDQNQKPDPRQHEAHDGRGARVRAGRHQVADAR